MAETITITNDATEMFKHSCVQCATKKPDGTLSYLVQIGSKYKFAGEGDRLVRYDDGSYKLQTNSLT